MSVQPGTIPEEKFGTLGGCLVEGDAEQQARQRKIRRRSLALSVVLQAAVLIAVVLIPLFARTERIALANVTPVPPYRPYASANINPSRPNDPGQRRTCSICFSLDAHPITSRPTSNSDPGPSDPRFDGFGPPNPNERIGIDVIDTRANGPRVPEVVAETPRKVHLAKIDPAMLKRRIEPVYPTLAIQIHREGRVEIHAIIGADGRMQSIQAIGGDPLFYSSALAAVQQWIYKPTYLNGQAVEVDTTITVIYSMQR